MSVTASPTPDASASVAGLVNTTAQAFAGVKTFNAGISSAVASGSNAVNLLDGARLNLSTADTNAYLSRFAADTIGAAGNFRIGTGTSGGTIRGGGNAIITCDDITGAAFQYLNSSMVMDSAQATFKGGGADGASAVAVVLGSYATYANSTARLVSIRNTATEVASFGPTGKLSVLAAAGNDAVKLLNGARLNLSTADVNAYVYRSAADTIGIADKLVIGAASGAGSSIVGGGTSTLKLDGSVGASLEYSNSRCTVDSTTVTVVGGAADSSTAIGAKIGSALSYATAGSRLGSFRNGGVEKAAVSYLGGVDQSGTDGSATAGAQTISKPTGKGKIASGATTCVITNTLVAAGSIIQLTWEGDHGAARSWVVPAAGSFTVTLSAAASANTVFNFEVKTIL